MSTWVIIVVVVVAVLVMITWYFSSFNSFVRLRNLVDESWRQVDVELQRRHDLVPNLVATVSASAAFEQTTLETVTKARAAALSLGQGADVAAIASAENLLSAALSRLQALTERYPELQAVRAYDALLRELEDTEDRIAASRRLYNANVRALNTRIGSMPASLVASVHHVPLAEYFEISEPARHAVYVAGLLNPDRDEDR